MKTNDFVTSVLKHDIFHCLASHEASGSKSPMHTHPLLSYQGS